MDHPLRDTHVPQEFIGRQALQTQMEQGVDRAVVLLSVNSPRKDFLPWGSEPIYCNGELLGSVTSVAYSHNSDKALCLGMITLKSKGDEFAQGEFELSISGLTTIATLQN